MAVNKNIIKTAEAAIKHFTRDEAVRWLRGFASYEPESDTSKKLTEMRVNLQKGVDK